VNTIIGDVEEASPEEVKEHTEKMIENAKPDDPEIKAIEEEYDEDTLKKIDMIVNKYKKYLTDGTLET
jgi:hypothetical protein